jgi:plastocyanin
VNGPEAVPVAGPPGRRVAAVRPALTALLLPILAMGAITGCGEDGDEEEVFSIEAAEAGEVDHHYVIPAGSGEAIDRGESLDILPADMSVQVGEVLEIVNEDDRGHLIGPFYVGAGETLRQEFSSPGTYLGICSVHPSGEITITVT